MRKSVQVTLTVAAGVALAACGSNSADRANPCDAATFSEQACQDAIAKGGYFWDGTWVPMNYSHPYPYYYGSYHAYISNGGTVTAAPAGAYSPAAGSVERGGFGDAGAAHAGGEGVGE
ncbi:MAG: hypothetical protein ABSE42_03355 [Bryobacteraceae bacterium]|jgi:hypothetical protein